MKCSNELMSRPFFRAGRASRTLYRRTRPPSGSAGIWPCLLVAAAFVLQSVSLNAAEVQATGIVEPFVDMTLSAPVPGILTSRKFEEGAVIPAGAVLLELDNNLERMEVERRKVVRDQKQRDYEGTKKLFSATKGISQEELETKETEYKVAAVEHEMAVEQLRRRQIITPHAGVITEIMLEIGEACAAYQPLIHVVDTSKCYLVASIEASQGARLTRDQAVQLQIDLGGGTATVSGKVTFVSPVVDPASGLQKVKILFDNADGKIRPGLTGVVLSQTQG